MNIKHLTDKKNILNKIGSELGALKLRLVDYNNGTYAVGRQDIANPLLFFKIKNSGKNYTGTIGVKAINAPLYTQGQIKGALQIVDRYLQEGGFVKDDAI